VVAQVLGHADTRMVEKKHYGHLSPSYVRDAVRATAMELWMHEINIAPLPRRALFLLCSTGCGARIRWRLHGRDFRGNACHVFLSRSSLART
jgi:hypothetical protein